jgi:hypothetical protein
MMRLLGVLAEDLQDKMSINYIGGRHFHNLALVPEETRKGTRLIDRTRTNGLLPPSNVEDPGSATVVISEFLIDWGRHVLRPIIRVCLCQNQSRSINIFRCISDAGRR